MTARELPDDFMQHLRFDDAEVAEADLPPLLAPDYPVVFAPPPAD